MSQPISGHTALVTGAASGIGRAVAARLVSDGAAVLLLDRDEAAVKEAASEIGAEHLVADLSDSSAIDALVMSSRLARGVIELSENPETDWFTLKLSHFY